MIQALKSGIREGSRINRACAAVAICLLAVSIAVFPQEDARTLYRKGTDAEFQEDYYRAIELYKEALLLNPSYLEPIIRLAESFHILEQDDEALAWAEKARKLDSGNPSLSILEAKIRTGLGEIETARSIYEAVLAEEPYNIEARFGMAQLDLADGKRRHAALQYLESLKAVPDNLHALLNLALLYEELGEEETSLTYLTQALRYGSDDPEVFYTAARYHVRQAEYPLAADYLRTALVLKPNYHEARLLLAELHILQGHANEAIPILREVLDSQLPDHRYRAHYLLGIAYGRAGSIREALQSYAWALRLRPDDEVSRMASEHLAIRNPDETAADRRRFALYHFEEGRKLENASQLAKAQVEYRRSLMLDKEYHEARLAFANIFRILGFPYKYLMELLFLRDYYDVRDTDVLDDIEIYENRLLSTVGYRWASELEPLRDPEVTFDQYAIERDPYRIVMFTFPADNALVHFLADGEFMTALENLLVRFDGLELVSPYSPLESFDQAYRAARDAGSDHFLIVRFQEDERSFRAVADIYLTRTGSHLSELSVYRTGNQRIGDALLRLSEEIARLFPIRGTLRAREFDKGVMDLGTFQGIQAGDRFVIVEKGKLTLRPDVVGYRYREEDILGEFVVTEVDENLSEGTIEPASFFDRINPGDELALPAENPQTGQ